MIRAEAIKILNDKELIKNMNVNSPLTNAYIWEAIEVVKTPISLAEFLGWEEDKEYRLGDTILKVSDGCLQIFDDDEGYFDDCYWFWDETNIKELRKATKVKKKRKDYHVKDRYSYDCLMKDLEKNGFTWVSGQKPTKFDGFGNGTEVVICADYDDKKLTYTGIDFVNAHSSKYCLIECKKEKPKFYAKIKGHELISRAGVYFRYHNELKQLVLGNAKKSSNPTNIVTNYLTKEEWNALGIDDTNADFEEVVE